MEKLPSDNISAPESTPDSKKDGKSKKRPFRFAPVSRETQPPASGITPKPEKSHSVLADLALPKQRNEHDPNTQPERPADVDRQPMHTPFELEQKAYIQAAAAEEADKLKAFAETEDDDDEQEEESTEKSSDLAHEKLNVVELSPDQLSGGEVVFTRSDHEAVVDHVVALHDTESVGPEQIIEPKVFEPVEYYSQPEQQQMARTVEASGPDDEDDPSKNSPPNIPGQTPPLPGVNPNSYNGYASANQPLIGPNAYPTSGAANLNVYPAVPSTQQVYNMNAAPVSPNVVGAVPTQRDVETAEYYGRREGLRNGLATGLFIGAAYEHFKHKRREKREAKRFKEQTKQLAKSQEQNSFLQQEGVKQHDALERAKQYAEQLPVVQNTPERTVVAAAEKRDAANPPSQEKPTLPVEQRMLQPAEQLEIPPEHRLESSAWHTIEVDAKTGKAVENATFAYGQEYHRERAHETKQADSQDNLQGVGAAALGSAIGLSDGRQPQSANALNDTTQREPAGGTTGARFKSKAKAGFDAATKQATAPGAIWPLVLALVVIGVVIIILL